MWVTMILVILGALRTVGKRPKRIGNQWKTRDHPEQNIVEISKNTEKSPGDLRRPAITQTPVKDHQLKLE